jgi:hypothetical protein
LPPELNNYGQDDPKHNKCQVKYSKDRLSGLRQPGIETKDKAEVDFVIEAGKRLIPVEVK